MAAQNSDDALRAVLEKAALNAANKYGLNPANVRLDDEDFIQPEGMIWGAFCYKTGQRQPAELGKQTNPDGSSKALDIVPGIITFDVLVPENTGRGPGLTLAGNIAKEFNRAALPVLPYGYVNFQGAGAQKTTMGAPRGFARWVVTGMFRFYTQG